MSAEGPAITSDWEEATIDWDAETTVAAVPTAIELMEHFEKCVVGHSRAKEALVGALRMHLSRNDVLAAPPRILLMGPRGVGKTTLAETMVEATDLPATRIDFGEVSVTGELDISRVLARMANPAEGHAPCGIVFLDGIEHLVRPPASAAPTFDGRMAQVDLLRAMDGLDVKLIDGRVISCDQLLICGAIAIEEPLKQTASQQDLRTILEAAAPLIPEFASRFDMLIPIEKLSAAQIAKSFALAHSPFARARRVIASLGGSFHVDPSAVEALARTCAMSAVGGWAAARAIDRLLEHVLRSPDPKKPWKLGSS